MRCSIEIMSLLDLNISDHVGKDDHKRDRADNTDGVLSPSFICLLEFWQWPTFQAPRQHPVYGQPEYSE